MTTLDRDWCRNTYLDFLEQIKLDVQSDEMSERGQSERCLSPRFIITVRARISLALDSLPRMI